jgi:hypothetical protein
MGLSAIFFDVSRTAGSSSPASTSEFRRLRVKVVGFDGKRVVVLGLYLGSEVVRLSRGLIADTGGLGTVRDGGLRVEVGDDVELSVFAGWATLEATAGVLSLPLSTLGDSFAVSLTVSFGAENADGGIRRLEFSLFPSTSAIAFETDNCPNECLTPDGLGIPGFLETLDRSGAEVDIVRSKQQRTKLARYSAALCHVRQARHAKMQQKCG